MSCDDDNDDGDDNDTTTYFNPDLIWNVGVLGCFEEGPHSNNKMNGDRDIVSVPGPTTIAY